MNLEAIQSSASALEAPDFLARDMLPTATMNTPPTADFGSLVAHGLNQVNQQLMVQQTDLQQLATGDVQNLHEVMIRIEETRLSFDLMMQLRNRMLEAYQDVMKMSV